MARTPEEIPDVIDNLRRVFQVLNEYANNAEKTTGLTGTQIWGMKLVALYAPIRVSDLARRMYLHPATVVGILDRLEARGLVTRTRSLKDRRAVDITLSSAGKEIVARAPEIAQDKLVKGLETLSDEEFSRVADGMAQMVRILRVEHIPPQQMHPS